MNYGDAEIVRKEGTLRLLKIGCKDGKESFCILGNGSTKHYENYDDALDDFNERWMKIKYGN